MFDSSTFELDDGDDVVDVEGEMTMGFGFVGDLVVGDFDVVVVIGGDLDDGDSVCCFGDGDGVCCGSFEDGDEDC